MSEPALLAVAHGSSDTRATATVRDLVAAAAVLRPALQVEPAWLDHVAPDPLSALTLMHGAGARAVVVVPLLLTEAFHSRVDLPAVLATARKRLQGLDIRQGHALGPHPLLVAALERRLADAGVAAGDPKTAVVLAAAGSSDPRAVATISEIAQAWRAAGWWDVIAAYASSAAPDVTTAVTTLRQAGAPRVAVASYLLAPGTLPDRVRSAAAGCVVSEPLGTAPEVAELLVHRYDDALAATTR